MKAEIDVLTLLDEIDAFRRSHQDEQQSPSDYCMRMIEAMIARAAGFNSRTEWTEALKEDPSSAYSDYLANYGVAFRG